MGPVRQQSNITTLRIARGRRQCAAGLFGALLACCAGCSGDAPRTTAATPVVEDPRAESAAWMRRTLDEYRRLGETYDPIFGDGALLRARDELAQHPGDVEAEIQIRQRIAEYELRRGQVREALEEFRLAQEFVDALGDTLPPDQRADALVKHAIGWLRLAETENCLHCRNGESCLLPISAAGVHEQKEGATKAAELFAAALEIDPNNLTARWLLNIAHMTLGLYPDQTPEKWRIPPEKFQRQVDFPRFTNVAQAKGLDTVSTAGGAVADDFNNDGTIDLLVSDWSPAAAPRLFLNDGRGGFVDRTEGSGLAGLFGGLNMVQADYDNDGDVDVLVLRGAWKGEMGMVPNSLLENDGAGKFHDVTAMTGLALDNYPTQTAAWADYDLDGDLDLFVGNEDYPSQLFRNDGRRFTDVAPQAGVQNHRYAKAVVCGDFDGDRYPDFYVSNYEAANRLYRNNHDGTFTDVAPALGVTGPLKSFPAWFWDFDNDGALDIFVASYPLDVEQVAAQFFDIPTTAERDHLYRGDGRGAFEEVAQQVGVTRMTDPMGCNFGDLDHDGFLDFYLGTGAPPFSYLAPNVMYWNREGKSFADVTYSGGFGHLQKGHAVAFADFDLDGDQDIFQEVGGAYPGDAFPNVYYENPGNTNHWITVKLVGRESNRSAIGARIRVTVEGEGGAPRQVFRWVSSGGSFGANPLRQQIGVGAAERIDELEIYWPKTGKSQVLRDLAVDQMIEIAEGDDNWRPLKATPLPAAPKQD
jgi:hypothetical protein